MNLSFHADSLADAFIDVWTHGNFFLFVPFRNQHRLHLGSVVEAYIGAKFRDRGLQLMEVKAGNQTGLARTAEACPLGCQLRMSSQA